MKRSKIAGFFRTVGFLLCLGIVLHVVSGAVRYPCASDTHFFEEPEDSIDVLFLGNCHSYSTFIPSLVQAETGLTGYVLGASTQDAPMTYYYLREALKHQSPSYVVLETFPLTIYESYVTTESIEAYGPLNFALLPFNLDRIRYAWDYTDGDGWFAYCLDLLQFHDRWEDVQSLHRSVTSQDNGYSIYWNREPLSNPEEILELVQTDRLLALDPRGEEYLYRIIDLVEEAGAQLILVTVPYTSMGENEAARHNTIAQIAQEEDIPYYNLTEQDTLEELQFRRGDMIDINHVNRSGGTLITEFLCDRRLEMEKGIAVS